VERFFGLLTDKALKRGSHTSITQLRAILAYVEAHNERRTPFKWVKTADEILDNMRPIFANPRTRARKRRVLKMTR
jgi:hypothetical protein